jgi:hypothetical protein
MNLMQRRRAAEAAYPAQPRGEGYWQSGTKLDLAGVLYPRGSVVPDATVAAFKPDRLAVLVSNGYLAFRYGKPPADAPQPSRPRLENPEAVAARMKENMLRDGYEPWEPANAIKQGGHRGGST